MQGIRRKVKVMVMMTMVFIFIVVEVSRNAGKGDGNKNKQLVPTKRFWAKDLPRNSYWNRRQQQLNYINNHNLEKLNFTIDKLPDWLNDTVNLDSCEPDFRVTTQVKDFSSLPDRFKDFLLYMHCRSYPIVMDQPNICKDPPFLLLAIKSLVPHFDRRQAIRESWGKAWPPCKQNGRYVVSSWKGSHGGPLSWSLKYASPWELHAWRYSSMGL